MARIEGTLKDSVPSYCQSDMGGRPSGVAATSQEKTSFESGGRIALFSILGAAIIGMGGFLAFVVMRRRRLAPRPYHEDDRRFNYNLSPRQDDDDDAESFLSGSEDVSVVSVMNSVMS